MDIRSNQGPVESKMFRLRAPSLWPSTIGLGAVGLILSPVVAVTTTGGAIDSVMQLIGITLCFVVLIAVVAGLVRGGSARDRLARAALFAAGSVAILGPVVVGIAAFGGLADRASIFWAVGCGLGPAIGYAMARVTIRAIGGPKVVVLAKEQLVLPDRAIAWSDVESVLSHSAVARRQVAVSVQRLSGERVVVGRAFDPTEAGEIVRAIRLRIGHDSPPQPPTMVLTQPPGDAN